MAETLAAVLLVTGSGKGQTLVFHWPPSPTVSPRLARPKPLHDANCSHVDNFWAVASNHDASLEGTDPARPCLIRGDSQLDGWEYEWKRPHTGRDHDIGRDRSRSFAHSRSRPGSRRASPSRDRANGDDASRDSGEQSYVNLLGYRSDFLSTILCPQRHLCHQKFELVVDDLAFIGHPVCSEGDGEWKFKPEKSQQSARGRGSRNKRTEDADAPPSEREPSPVGERSASHPKSNLHIFHLVLVMDLPDPSSSASGNLFKYFHVIYEHVSITVTAVLFQEQVMNGFVEKECDALSALREVLVSKGEPYSSYITQALQISSLAKSMKTLYESIKSNSIARLAINELGIELQLPPYLDNLLHTEEEESDYIEHEDPDAVTWSPKLSFGWRLPSLAPWKSLLIHDMDVEDGDFLMNLRSPGMSPEDQELAEGLIQFLQSASIFDSLAVMADSLAWDLETQVYPTVRWLIEHRKAKIVDTVHRDLKTVFVLPAKLKQPLPQLSAEFAKDFSQAGIPSLPQILATMTSSSSATSKHSGQADNHFFATVVRSKDMLPIYRDVVVWMLKRDLLVTLHLRVRIVATAELKVRVHRAREESAARRDKKGRRSDSRVDGGWNQERRQSQDKSVVGDDGVTEAFSEMLTRGRRRRHSHAKGTVNGSQSSVVQDNMRGDGHQDEDEAVDSDSGEDEGGWETAAEDNFTPSIIAEPGQATRLQRRWLDAMSEDKDPYLVERFAKINQYFDGKRTNDEILYRADISRKELREVLHHYEEYLLTFLHPA
ncbi:hypothetical protein BD410DRAFT_840090 [Rickenella mellea]|uniref:Nitrogen permease regulator 3 n=1 Tax=Rickenella mellea TaxID=50990 RepID=A0A4Y7Q3Y1_9AGAM|nr:hypothetical protein BD410DRAFT_840090 [Rickenella mellea]